MFELAPVTPPVIAPTVQEKLLAIDAASEIFVLVPLQMGDGATGVITGDGLTVTVIVNGAPVQDPPIEVGVTI